MRIKYRVKLNKILDKATNKSQDIRIEASSGLTEEEIEKMKKEAEANADADQKVKEEVDKLNSADQISYLMKKRNLLNQD